MQTWTVVRFLHLVGIVFFVGGQVVLIAAVVPALRGRTQDDAMRSIARRFGIGSGVALALVVATGVAMASHFSLWGSQILRAKLFVLALVAVLTGLHVAVPGSRPISYTIAAASLLVLWLGVKLTYG